MRCLPHLLIALALSLSVTGCQVISKLKLGKTAPEEEAVAELKAIGTVEMVNPEAGFVIVHTMANVPVTAGTELTAVGSAGTSAKLKVTPERKSIFITADIISGNPTKGDTVLRGPGPAPAAETTTAVPGSASTAPVAGIPESNLLRSAAPLPGTNPAPPLPLPQQDDFLRVVPSGAPR